LKTHRAAPNRGFYCEILEEKINKKTSVENPVKSKQIWVFLLESQVFTCSEERLKGSIGKADRGRRGA